MTIKTKAKRPKLVYSSGVKLGDAFRLEQIEREVRLSNGVVTADPDTIWNGPKLHVLVARNRKLGVLVQQNVDVVSLGSQAKDVVQLAYHRRAQYRWAMGTNHQHVRQLIAPEHQPMPRIRLDRVEERHRDCTLAELQHDALQSYPRLLEQLIRRYSDFRHGDNELWDNIAAELAVINLTIPEKYEQLRLVEKAKHRLLD